jgi:hypothetical protein
VAAQAVNSIDYEWFSYRRVRVLRELAQFRTEREGAASLGIAYTSFRGTVQEVKNKTGLHDVREIGRWWLAERPKWLAWVAKQGGLSREGDGS